jgi:hypothetical protein
VSGSAADSAYVALHHPGCTLPRSTAQGRDEPGCNNTDTAAHPARPVFGVEAFVGGRRRSANRPSRILVANYTVISVRPKSVACALFYGGGFSELDRRPPISVRNIANCRT